jgi:hypothetical protein
MARFFHPLTDYGAWLLAASAAAGLCLSLFNYFWPGTGIDGTPGALLVVVSSALVLGAALLMALDRSKGLALRVFLNVSTVLGVIGTATAAYFLDTYVLIAFMALGLVGWLWHIVLGPPERGMVPAAQTQSGVV